MEIVLVSPEMYPFSKVGGLGDAVGALPKALRALGHKVTVVSLRYGSIDPASFALARRLMKVKVPLGAGVVDAELWETRLPSGVNVVLLGAPGISDRPGVYGEDGKPYDDNHLRFALLSRGAVEWIRMQPTRPDVVHVHDWPAALVPVYLRELAASDASLASIRTVLTIHNLAHQGLFPVETLAEVGLPDRYAAVDAMEFYGSVSWLKGAVLHADRVTTVSPAYAREVLTPEGGMRMDGVLRTNAKGFMGILNGVDPAVWNPATDPHLVTRYDAEDPSPKSRCKTDLQQKVGLPVRPEVPLLGLVARIDRQKGIDVLLGALPQLLRQDVQLVVQGSGDAALRESLRRAAAELPDKLVFTDAYDDALAHRIYGGSDFFLVPSRFEPCGLTQMYAMRYGTVPIVRAAGGLRDTVVDCSHDLVTGTGFVFGPSEPDALYGAISRALVAFGNTSGMATLRRRVMRQDWSWDRAARRYQSVYQSVVPAAAEPAAATAG